MVIEVHECSVPEKSLCSNKLVQLMLRLSRVFLFVSGEVRDVRLVLRQNIGTRRFCASEKHLVTTVVPWIPVGRWAEQVDI